MADIATPISADPFGTAPKSPAISKYMQGSQDHFDSMPAPQTSALSSTGGLAQPTPTLGMSAAPDISSTPAAKNAANTAENVQGTSIRPANADELGLNGDPIADMGRAQNDIMNTKVANAQKARQSSLNGLGVMDTSGGGPIDGLDSEQSANAQAIIRAGKARGLSDGDIQIGIMTALAESQLRNVNGGDRDSLGLFQQRPSQGWGAPSQVLDPTYAAGKFFDGLSTAQGANPWNKAQAVQRSAFSDGSNYQAQFARSQAIMNSYNQGARSAPTVGANGSAQWITSNTNKYLDYDGAYGAQCVDLYDFYTTGFAGGQAPMVGYADEIWQNHDPKAYQQVSANQGTQMGDVAVWGKGGATPMSHVGIIIQDMGNGFVKTLSNNATSAGNKGSSAVVTISKANLLGYLRPRKLM